MSFSPQRLLQEVCAAASKEDVETHTATLAALKPRNIPTSTTNYRIATKRKRYSGSISATAAELFNQSRREKQMKPVTQNRKIPTVEEVRAEQKRYAEREVAPVQANIPALVPETPVRVPAKALENTDAYFNRSPGNMVVGPLAKFDGKDGKFTFLGDGIELSAETAFVVLVDGIWARLRRFRGEGEPPEHAGGLLFEDGYRRPARDELSDPDPTSWPLGKFSGQPEDPWRECVYLPLEERGTREVLTLVMSGPTPMSTQIIAVDGLLAHCKNVRRRFPDQYPIIKLAVGKYKNKKFGMLPKPLFKVVGMTPKDGAAAPGTSAGADMNDEIPY